MSVVRMVLGLLGYRSLRFTTELYYLDTESEERNRKGIKTPKCWLPYLATVG